jgi:hypothetical protein
VSADPAAIFVGLGNVVGADCDQPAVGNLELTMELNKPFRLTAVLGAATTTAENENHGMLSLQFGELPVLRRVVGKLVVGKDDSWNNVRSHAKSSIAWFVSQIALQWLAAGVFIAVSANVPRQKP